MEHMTVGEAVENRGVSRRAVTYHSTDGRVFGAVKRGNLRLIPGGAVKSRRRKKAPKEIASRA